MGFCCNTETLRLCVVGGFLVVVVFCGGGGVVCVCVCVCVCVQKK